MRKKVFEIFSMLNWEKEDIKVAASRVFYEEDLDGPALVIDDRKFLFSESGLRSLFSYLRIPMPFIFRLSSELREKIVNYFKREKKNFFIRIYDGQIWGVLSPLYVPFDHYQVLESLPQFLLEAEAERISVDPDFLSFIIMLEEEKDGFRKCVLIQNSETGWHSLLSKLMVLKMICSNGAYRLRAEEVYRHAHVSQPRFQEWISSIMGRQFLLPEGRLLSSVEVFDLIKMNEVKEVLEEWKKQDQFEIEEERKEIKGNPNSLSLWNLVTSQMKEGGVPERRRIQVEEILSSFLTWR